MARRKDHTRDELKALIIEKAWVILGSEGLQALTARRIGSEIGYAPGTIYNIFDGMDGVILHINAKTLALLLEELKQNHENENACAAMKQMAQRYITFAKANYPYWITLFNHQVGDERLNEEWYFEKITALFEPLEKILGKEHRKDARMLWSSVHGIAYLYLTGKLPDCKSDQDAYAMTDRLVDLYCQSNAK